MILSLFHVLCQTLRIKTPHTHHHGSTLTQPDTLPEREGRLPRSAAAPANDRGHK